MAILNQTTNLQQGIDSSINRFLAARDHFLSYFSMRTPYHIPVFWIPAIPAGMTMRYTKPPLAVALQT